MLDRPWIVLFLVAAILLTQKVAAQSSPADLVAGAESQLGVTTGYDPSYRRLDYPMGDVPIDTGVCTDVVIRAYRALGVDLQRLVHEDMRAAFAAYPALWGLTRPDRNIDHRRVPNLETFLRRYGESLAISDRAEDYRAGDLVTWRLPGNLPHIGIVAADRDAADQVLIIHNIGFGAKKEAMLLAYPISGHFRYFPEPKP